MWVSPVRVVLYLVIFAAATFSTACGESVKDALISQYQHHVLVLRLPFQAGTQEFNSDGKPLHEPPLQEWTMRGAISAEKISVDSHRLRIEGPPVAVNAQNKTNAAAVPLGKPVKVEIHLAHALASMEEARNQLNKIFFLDDQLPQHGLPEYQRPGVFPEKVYRFKEDGVSSPVSIFAPSPDYDEKARTAEHEGTVLLGVVIDEAGRVARISLENAAGMGLDQQAIEKVKTWRFKPGLKDGQPVAVQIKVEVSFNQNSSLRDR